MISYDLTVIGAGPGGYVAAVRAAQLGKKVAVVEKNQLGGTCLNMGCIPSKVYLQHAQWALTQKKSINYGFQTDVQKPDFAKLWDRKNQVVQTLQNGVSSLFRTNKVTYYNGTAKLISNHIVQVDDQKLNTQKILLATGSLPFVPPIAGLQEVDYETTDTFFNLQELPQQLVIIGGGVIAVELAFAMRPLGVEVSVIEVAPDILLTEDADARKLIKQQMQHLGMKIITAAKIQQVESQHVIVNGQTIPYDCLLVATGRKTDFRLPDQLQLKKDAKQKFVAVDSQYRTSVEDVYAIGDLIGGYQLAHVASREGLLAVANMFAQPQAPLDKNLVPRGVYSFPEVASFGLSFAQAQHQYANVIVQKVPFANNAKALAADAPQGFIKLISEKEDHQILGAVIVGEHATELIQTILAVKNAEGTLDELAATVFAHPTLSEAIGDVTEQLLIP